MKRKTYFLLTAILFTAVALFHGVRVVMGWDLVINDFLIPTWVSALATFITVTLLYFGYKYSE